MSEALTESSPRNLFLDKPQRVLIMKAVDVIVVVVVVVVVVENLEHGDPQTIQTP